MPLPLPRTVIGSRVGWRFFSLFMIASFVPLAAVAVLLLTQTAQTLEERAFDELGEAGRGFGQASIEKLLAVVEWLPAVQAVAATESLDLASLGITAATIQSSAGAVAFGEPYEFPPMPPLRSSRPALVLPEQGAAVLIARPHGDGAVMGAVDPEYLWMSSASLGDAMEVCVFAGTLQSAPLFCSLPLPEAASSALHGVAGSPSSGTLTWSDRGERWHAAYWQLFVSSRFDGEPWFIVVSRPRSVALESLTPFNRVAPTVLALSLILIVLLSASQIRRTLDPLNRLLAGTRRIAAQEFDARVDVPGNDEFSVLGRAMNEMTERLGRQFGTLTTLAEIDRLILSSEDIEQVLEAVLERVRAIAPAGAVGVLLIEPDQPDRGRLYGSAVEGGERGVLRRMEISESQRSWLSKARDGGWADARTLADRGVELIVAADRSRTFFVPILRGETLAGALFATFASDAAVGNADLQSLRELAGRLAVATAAAEREKALFQRAHFDPLTGMPNRELCQDRLRQALAQARRNEHRVAVLFIDLDGFKNINDSLGHWAGDELLRETALRIQTAARDTDTVARLGGDEFVVILPHVQSSLDAESIAARVMAALERPFVIEARESFVTASVGVTMFPDDGGTAEELLRKADTAMYGAKDAGRARCVFFSEEMDQRVHERLSLSTDLRKALANGELSLVYQPQVALGAELAVSAEALLRWTHPTRGPVSPQVFVPILEETGLIESVGDWVLQTALRDVALWRRVGLPIARIAVNVAARQLLLPGFAGVVAERLRAAGLTGDCLELELTETTLVRDFGAVNACLADLARHGVRIAIDDFGTGYSSLGYLNELVFDVLKIDRAFVVNLPADKSVAIVKAILAVAAALGKEVVAEGIESAQQCAQLTRLGCQRGQGYLFSRPLDRRALATWITAATVVARGPVFEAAAARQSSIGV